MIFFGAARIPWYVSLEDVIRPVFFLGGHSSTFEQCVFFQYETRMKFMVKN